MRSLSHGLDIVIRQDHTGAGLYMWRKDNLRFLLMNFSNHVGNRCGRKRRSDPVSGLPRLHHRAFRRKAASFKDLAPTVREPPVTHHQRLLPCRKLTRHSLHAVGPAARNQGHRVCFINLLQKVRDIPHNLLKSLGHMV